MNRKKKRNLSSLLKKYSKILCLNWEKFWVLRTKKTKDWINVTKY